MDSAFWYLMFVVLFACFYMMATDKNKKIDFKRRSDWEIICNQIYDIFDGKRNFELDEAERKTLLKKEKKAWENYFLSGIIDDDDIYHHDQVVDLLKNS